MRKNQKLIFYILIGVLCLGIVVYHLANHLVHNKLVALLENNLTDLSVKRYEDLKVNVWKGQLRASNFEFRWLNANEENSSFIKSKNVHIEGFQFIKFWRDKEIKINRLKISDSEIHLVTRKKISKDSSASSSKPSQVPKISIAEVFIKNTKFSKQTENGVLQAKFKLRSATLENIILEDWNAPQALYSNLDSYQLEFDDLYYKPTEWEAIEIEEIVLSEKKYQIKNLYFHTELAKDAYNAQLTYERDHYSVEIPDVTISPLQWDNHEARQRFFIATIDLSSPIATIYRDKLLPDDTSYKPLFGQLLRELKFYIQTDEIKISEANITYTERVQEENSGGSVYFSDFDAVLTDIGNFKEINEQNPVRIHVETSFMKTGRLKADWQFNPQDKNDAFHFQAAIYDLDANRANTFTEPNLFVKMEGKIDHVYLNIHGNNTNSNTDFAIAYNNLKIELLDKDGEKHKKLISALANIFVRKNSESENTKLQEEKVEIKRDQTKSIFNFLWKNTLEGLKKTILKV